MIKSLLLCAMALVYILLIELSHKPLFECFDGVMGTLVPIDTVSVTVVVLFVVAVALHGRQVEWMTRLDFLWQLQVFSRKNIIPMHNGPENLKKSPGHKKKTREKKFEIEIIHRFFKKCFLFSEILHRPKKKNMKWNHCKLPTRGFYSICYQDMWLPIF